MQEDLTVTPEHGSSSSAPLSHRLVAATYCIADRPIISIHSTPVPSSLCSSPLPHTPVPTTHVLVVLGSSETKENSCPSMEEGCLVQIYELSSSPRPSPLASPLVNGAGSLSSSPNSFSVFSRRDSVSYLSDPGSSLPKLSIVGASRRTNSYLPLPDNKVFT